jgi:hypothetical protein
MKTFGIIIKIVVALAAIAGAIYLAATYGERVVAWARKFLSRKRNRNIEYEYDYDCEEEEDGVDFTATDADDVVAAEADFEG